MKKPVTSCMHDCYLHIRQFISEADTSWRCMSVYCCGGPPMAEGYQLWLLYIVWLDHLRHLSWSGQATWGADHLQCNKSCLLHNFMIYSTTKKLIHPNSSVSSLICSITSWIQEIASYIASCLNISKKSQPMIAQPLKIFKCDQVNLEVYA